MENKANSRRNFIKKSAGASAAVIAGGILPGYSALSYSRIMGSNERIRVSAIGVNARGNALANNFASQPNSEIVHVCDVDSRAIEKCIKAVEGKQALKVKAYGDFRESLESREIDAVVIAMPDHWHAPASLLAIQAGKHVYVEKPCSHNPNEGEILREGAARYGKVIQMGNQRRSWPNVIEGIQALKNGEIGRAYFGKSWYTNNRGPIGLGKEVEVPEWLDWELWQGPAPRQAYKDNIVHYNWHWRWNWGTGEALNNGTHMVDLLRWGFGVDYPVRVSSNGGRYRYQDDWETPDTQVISYDFAEGITMTWEGRSCNGTPIEGSSVGAMFYGEKGTLLLAGGNSYTIFDLKGNVVKEVKDDFKVDARNTSDPAKNLDALHIQNFFSAITKGEALSVVDFLNTWGLIAIGLGLVSSQPCFVTLTKEGSVSRSSTQGILPNVRMTNTRYLTVDMTLVLGLFTRVAAWAGAILLLMYYLNSAPIPGIEYSLPTEGNYLIISKTLIEAVALMAIAVFPTGTFIGLDVLFSRFVNRKNEKEV